MAGRPRVATLEESPDSMRLRCRVTPGRGNPRESATENRPPRAFGPWVRVKRWGKSPPRDGQPDRHGKPHQEQCRIGASRGCDRTGFRIRAISPQGRLSPEARVGSSTLPVTAGPDEWPSKGVTPEQNPAYRPSAQAIFLPHPGINCSPCAARLSGGAALRGEWYG